MNRHWYKIGAVIMAAAVLVVSSWPSLSVKTIGWVFEDKLQHALVYTILGYLAFRGWVPSGSMPPNRRAVWIILLILAVFAAADEYHQRWIPGRFVEWGDFLADGIGVVIGFLLGAWHNRRLRKKPTPRSPGVS